MENIKDAFLAEKIRNSTDYIYFLHDLSNEEKHNDILKEETYRVIILYVVSCIEALLIYLYKNREEKIEVLEYKNIYKLQDIFQNDDNKYSVTVLALQTKSEKDENHVGLQEVVKHFEKIKVIKKETSEQILTLNNIRNTHHLFKNRSKKCEISDVDSSFVLFNYILEKVNLALSNKK
jgi:hypothetical protein